MGTKFIYDLALAHYKPNSPYEKEVFQEYVSILQKGDVTVKDRVLLFEPNLSTKQSRFFS